VSSAPLWTFSILLEMLGTQFPPSRTSYSFVYTEPVGFNSLFIGTTDSTASEPNESGRSSTSLLTSAFPTWCSPSLGSQ